MQSGIARNPAWTAGAPGADAMSTRATPALSIIIVACKTALTFP